MTRRLTFAVSIVLCLGLLLGNATNGGEGDSGERSRMDSVVGVGLTPVELANSNGQGLGLPMGNGTVAAHSGPNGEDARGTLRVRTSSLAMTAQVTGLQVDGNVAIAGGPIKTGNEGWDADWLFIIVEDMGKEPDNRSVIVVWGFGGDEPPIWFIDLFYQWGIFDPQPVAQGEYIVRDAQ